jgi:glycosyltransferase involved in cell wall biosynthesis
MNPLPQMAKPTEEISYPLSGSARTAVAGSRIHTIVAMPAFNEEKYIAKTIVGAKKYADAVLVVDDGSYDDTVEIARALGAIVVQHRENQGYGGALKTIFNTTRKLGAEELVILDADGQHNPGDIPKLLDGLKSGNDVVIGSRFVEGMDSYIPRYRKIGMKVLDTATQFAGDIKVTDSQSGFRAYGRRAIEAIRLNGNGMSAGSEILVQIGRHNLKVAETPIKVRYDIEETSSQNPLSHGFSVLANIIKMIGSRKPIWFFGAPGFVITGVGLITGFLAFSEYYSTSMFHYPFSIACALTLIMGLLLITSGLILNFLVNVMGVHRGVEGPGISQNQNLPSSGVEDNDDLDERS